MLLICDHGFIVCLLLFLVGFFCFSLGFLNSYQTYDHRKFKGALHLNEKRHIYRWSYVDLAVNYIYFLQILSTSFWFAKRSLSIVINCRNLKVFFPKGCNTEWNWRYFNCNMQPLIQSDDCRLVQFIHIY